MQPCSYPKPLLLFDGLRAAVGIALTTGPLLVLEVSHYLAILLAALALLFIWFGYRVLTQSITSVTLKADGLLYQGWRQHQLDWQDLNGLKLAYYAPMRRRGSGWYQLTLKSNGKSLSLESTLAGFDNLLPAAIKAANDANLTFDASTSDNLQAWLDKDGLAAHEYRVQA